MQPAPKMQAAPEEVENIAALIRNAKNPVIVTETAGRDPAAYEAHIATPSEDVDLAALWPGLREIRTDRRQNVRLHRELVERLAESLS